MAQSHDGHGSYDLLFETDRGRVLHCDCCGCLQLRFGNAILGLNAEDFEPLRDTIVALERDALEFAASGDATGDERATIFLGESGTGFAFATEELTELHRLLEGAGLFLDIQRSARDRHGRDLRDRRAS